MYNEVDCGIHPYKDNFVGLDSTTVATTYEVRRICPTVPSHYNLLEET